MKSFSAAEANRNFSNLLRQVRDGQIEWIRDAHVINPPSPEETTKFFRSEIARYAKLVKKAGVKLD